eukprot:297548-Rhodomonas_salina.2
MPDARTRHRAGPPIEDRVEHRAQEEMRIGCPADREMRNASTVHRIAGKPGGACGGTEVEMSE